VTVEAIDDGNGNEFYITDLGGRTVASGKLENEKTTIDLSSLAQGTYLIGIVTQRRRPVKILKL
jgi:hypothetical protein